MSATIGFDTATAVLTVAAANGDEVIAEVGHGPDDEGRPRASELLLVELERIAAAAGGWEGINRIAVGIGPGSFTGLRIGVATARALAQGRALPLAAVSTLAALGRGIGEREPGADALAVIDARRGEAFAALYDERGGEAWAPFVCGPEELGERAAGLQRAPLAAGDGSVRFREQLEAAGVRVAAPDDPVHRVAARHICALGDREPARAPAEIEPLYLREPDAQRWLKRDDRDFSH